MISDKELREYNRRSSIASVRRIEKDLDHKFGSFARALAFLEASRFSLNEELERMLEAGVDVNIRSAENYTALILANDFSTVRLLLSHGADPNLQDVHGRNALIFYLSCDNYQRKAIPIIKELIKAGADATLTLDDGTTVLDLYASKYKDDVVYKLLEDTIACQRHAKEIKEKQQ